MSILTFKRGDILKTPKFNEPVRVLNDPRPSDGFVLLDLVGLRTNTFRGGVIFTPADLPDIEIQSSAAGYQGDPKLFKLGLEALRIRLAFEYDPFFGLSISRVDPLPISWMLSITTSSRLGDVAFYWQTMPAPARPSWQASS